MSDYKELYKQSAAMFEEATGVKPEAELLFIDQFTNLMLIHDALRRNQVPLTGFNLSKFDGFDAEVLFGEAGNVLMIRTDSKASEEEQTYSIIREMARLYLHDRNQLEIDANDTFTVVGENIWMEFAAEILTRAIVIDNVPMMLYELDVDAVLKEGDPLDLAAYAVEVVASYEGRVAKNWPDLQKEMQMQGLPWEKIIHTLFEKIKSGDWDTDEFWLSKLGAAYYIENGLQGLK